MALSQMEVYNEYIMKATIARVAQRVDVFNAASNGAIVLSVDGFTGDVLMASSFKSISSAIRRVDRYAVNGDVAATPLEEIEDKIVKIAGGATVIWEPGQFSWLQRNEAEAIANVSTGLADGIIEDQLNTGIMGAVAAIGNNADATYDISATAGISYSALNSSHALFGDRSTAIVAEIMNGAAYHKLIGENLSNTANLFSSDSVTVVDILGKRVVVTDSPALIEAGTPNLSKVLSLQSQGILVLDTSDIITNIDRTNGKARIETTFQADYTFGLGIKGYAWDEVNGGVSPEDSDISTGTNWDQYVDSIKDTAGVITIVDADQ